MLTHDAALDWIARWDRQQEGYLPDREERFTALIDAVEALDRPDPLVIDLGCGPGSLSARLLTRLPQGHGHLASTPTRCCSAWAGPPTRTSRFVTARPAHPRLDGRARPGPSRRRRGQHHRAALDLAARPARACTPNSPPRCAPAACCSTATTWTRTTPPPPWPGSNAPCTSKQTERTLRRRPRPRTGGPGGTPSPPTPPWPRSTPPRTTAGADHHGSESHLLSQHADALREAGFSEIGTLWQRGNNRLLCAVR